MWFVTNHPTAADAKPDTPTYHSANDFPDFTSDRVSHAPSECISYTTACNRITRSVTGGPTDDTTVSCTNASAQCCTHAVARGPTHHLADNSANSCAQYVANNQSVRVPDTGTDPTASGFPNNRISNSTTDAHTNSLVTSGHSVKRPKPRTNASACGRHGITNKYANKCANSSAGGNPDNAVTNTRANNRC